MDRCFRAALGMFLLISCLQAAPVSPCTGERNVCELDQVKCADNVRFISPNVTTNETCHHTVMKYFMDGLLHAKANCTDDETSKERIEKSWNTLEYVMEEQELTASSGCELNTSQTKFVKFVDDIRTFVQLLNSRTN